MLSGRGLALVCALACACGGSRSKRSAIDPPDPLHDVGVGIEELRRDLESTVLENYSHLGLGNLHAFADSVADGEPIALLGPRASDLVVHGSRGREMRDRRLYRTRDVRLLSKNLQLHLSDDGSAAWVADEISYRVPYGGRTGALSLRYSAVFVRRSGRWEIMAEHLSYPVAAERVLDLARAGRLPRQRSLGTRVFSGAESVGSAVAHLYEAPRAQRKAVMSAALSSLVWLPGRSAEYRGDEIGASPTLAEMFGASARVERTGLIAYVTESRTIAWAAEQLYVRTTSADIEVLVPLQVLYVLERTEDEWKVVQMHASVPLATPLINELVFGESELSD